MITFTQKGSFNKTEKFLAYLNKGDLYGTLDAWARVGVNALVSATPVESGETSRSWAYKIAQKGAVTTITWTNSHIVDGVPIAIILQYGHGTGTGGYIQGRDYINPALKPTFTKIADQVWKAVTSA
jgi:hypothetical protein